MYNFIDEETRQKILQRNKRRNLATQEALQSPPTDNGPTIGFCTECNQPNKTIVLNKPGAEVCEDCIDRPAR